jgi:hypothetical protein
MLLVCSILDGSFESVDGPCDGLFWEARFGALKNSISITKLTGDTTPPPEKERVVGVLRIKFNSIY